MRQLKSRSAKILFVTGTDTGVGKTLLTGLLLCHLRAQGARAVAMKPFCSGGRADAELLQRLQADELSLDEVNPFYFPEPVAPLISARKHKRRIPLESVVDHVQRVAARLADNAPGWRELRQIKNSKLRIKNYLLIEGSGGLLVPLGEGYTVRDLIAQLGCDILVVCPNKLGTINHTLLTLNALGAWPRSSVKSWPASNRACFVKVVMMGQRSKDFSSHTNPAILGELIHPWPLLELPFLGRNCTSVAAVRRTAAKLPAVLSKLV
jgi:dethiobiotin synthetase